MYINNLDAIFSTSNCQTWVKGFSLILGNFLEKFIILGVLFSVLFFIFKNIKFFILVYIALRSFFAIFYNVDIAFGFNVLELLGVIFPLILLIYWARLNFQTARFNSNYNKIYILIIIWVIISNFFSFINYGFYGLNFISSLFRVLNGFSVFIVFPLIFKTIKDIKDLMYSFFVCTLFPLFQGLIQLAFGANIGGMRTSAIESASKGFVMYYGLYHKYGWYAMSVIFAGCFIIYRLSMKEKILNKNIIFFNSLFILYLLLASMTLSRTLMIDLIIITLFLFLGIKKKKFKLITAIIIFLFIISTGFFHAQFKHLLTRSESEIRVFKGEIERNYALHGRFGLWVDKFQRFNKYSLLEKLVGSNITIGPHGDYIQWVLSYGYIGAILYLILISTLFFGSIRSFMNINRAEETQKIRSYGLMVLASLVIWIIGSFIYNPTASPDLSYFVLGNTAIFLYISKKYDKRKNFNLRTSFI